MTTAIKDLFQEVNDVTTDDTLVRWTCDVLARYYNAGLELIANLRPDASIIDETFTCVAGSLQTLPDGSTQLIQARHNVSHSGKGAITPASASRLDAARRNWRSMAGKTYVYHVVYDARYPLQFEVFPPVLVSTTIRIVRGVEPTHLAIPAEDSVIADLTGNVPLQDKYINALREYMLHRCYDMDSKGQNNPNRSAMHLARVGDELGIEIKAKIMSGPRTNTDDPNVLADTPVQGQ